MSGGVGGGQVFVVSQASILERSCFFLSTYLFTHKFSVHLQAVQAEVLRIVVDGFREAFLIDAPKLVDG